MWSEAKGEAARHVELLDGREWISGGVVAAGVGIAAFGVQPQERRAWHDG